VAATAPIVDRARPARGARGLVRPRAVLPYLAPAVTGSSLAAYHLAFGALTWIAAGVCVSGAGPTTPLRALSHEMTQRRSLR
jgi:hypothetical protein